MDEVVRLTRTYVVVVWLFALLVGALAGAGLGFLLKEPWTGVIVGIGVAALVGSSAILGHADPGAALSKVRLHRPAFGAPDRTSAGPAASSSPLSPCGRRPAEGAKWTANSGLPFRNVAGCLLETRNVTSALARVRAQPCDEPPFQVSLRAPSSAVRVCSAPLRRGRSGSQRRRGPARSCRSR